METRFSDTDGYRRARQLVDDQLGGEEYRSGPRTAKRDLVDHLAAALDVIVQLEGRLPPVAQPRPLGRCVSVRGCDIILESRSDAVNFHGRPIVTASPNEDGTDMWTGSARVAMVDLEDGTLMLDSPHGIVGLCDGGYLFRATEPAVLKSGLALELERDRGPMPGIARLVDELEAVASSLPPIEEIIREKVHGQDRPRAVRVSERDFWSIATRIGAHISKEGGAEWLGLPVGGLPLRIELGADAAPGEVVLVPHERPPRFSDVEATFDKLYPDGRPPATKGPVDWANLKKAPDGQPLCYPLPTGESGCFAAAKDSLPGPPSMPDRCRALADELLDLALNRARASDVAGVSGLVDAYVRLRSSP